MEQYSVHYAVKRFHFDKFLQEVLCHGAGAGSYNNVLY